jgi:thioredoxin-like negative regulator of GroEL
MDAPRTSSATAAGPIEPLTGATFDALVVRGDGPIVVEFMSYGCSHCRALEPVLLQVAGALVHRVRVMRVNVAVDADLAAAYRVRVTPTLVSFLDGGEIARVEGPRPAFASLSTTVTRPFDERDADR